MAKRKYSNLWRKRYALYNRKFKQKIKETGFEPVLDKFDTLQEFKRAFIVENQKIKKGEVKKPNRGITEDLVNQSFYRHSYKEARALMRKAKTKVKELGLSFSDLRREENIELYETYLYDEIREERERLFKEGKSASQVRREISQRYWGSK